MFGNCEECAYCRTIGTKKGDEIHVCARRAPVFDKSLEKTVYPIVQIYGTDECRQGCGEFYPDYERIKAKALKDMEPVAMEKATEEVYEMMDMEIEGIAKDATRFLSGGNCKTILNQIIDKSIESGTWETFPVTWSSSDPRVRIILRDVLWQMALTIAERKGASITKGVTHDKNAIFKLKAKRNE